MQKRAWWVIGICAALGIGLSLAALWKSGSQVEWNWSEDHGDKPSLAIQLYSSGNGFRTGTFKITADKQTATYPLVADSDTSVSLNFRANIPGVAESLLLECPNPVDTESTFVECMIGKGQGAARRITLRRGAKQNASSLIGHYSSRGRDLYFLDLLEEEMYFMSGTEGSKTINETGSWQESDDTVTLKADAGHTRTFRVVGRSVLQGEMPEVRLYKDE